MLLLITVFQSFSQTKGISYQAVILNPQEQELPGVNAQGNILANSAVSIQFTIVNASGTEEYREKHSTNTDRYGMINLLIGAGTPISGNNFADIFWDGTSKNLKIGIDFSGGSNFSPLSEQILTYMPHPSIAVVPSVADAINDGITTVAPSQNAVFDALVLKANLASPTFTGTVSGISSTMVGLGNVDNTSDVNKPISIATQTALDGKVDENATIVGGTKTKITYDAKGLVTAGSDATTTDITEGTNLYYTEARVSANTDVVANTAKIGITTAQASEITDNTAKVGITVQQASDITANNAKVSDINHVATSTTTDLTEGTNLYYTEARVSANTDVVANTAKTGITTAQATTISNTTGVNTGDNASNILYSGLVTNATHSGDVTGAGALTLATVNSNVGTFNNITINAKGLATAGSNVSYLTSETDPIVKAINGIVKSNGTAISAAIAGTDYLAPNGSAALLTTFPTLNQNTTGNAATVTTNADLTGDVTSTGNATTIANKITMTATAPVSITGSPTVIASSSVAISIAAATASAAGSMSAADKTKLDGLTNADGSETKVTAGTNVTVTGTGTTVTPYVINSTGGGGVLAFAEFFALMPGDNSATVAVGTAVDFPQDGPTSNSGITRLTVTTFQLAAIGTYMVSWQVSITEAGQLVLVLDGTQIARTVVGRAMGTTQITGNSLITTTSANSILSVNNPTGNTAALTLTPKAGGLQSVSATLVITRIQ